ncbi:NACHT, LRR and PYD domains-containing protein 1 homolog isoform X2 [Myxocyprinus asiaticus]|uniref:NACHT, LRR and PYD domains-containing protein 1 homolog isoform X2 n=1 Tax=Myxocyprinus asiaticus TaxID=70543 RepID=UPI00222277D6|nr:NACHT, LRR and PYD domains-containing protein 1 homolog isoform X2 [Myxocyprinus asiaticus]
MSESNRDEKEQEPVKDQSTTILQYKTSVIDKCEFVTELPSDEHVRFTTRYIEPVIFQTSLTKKNSCEHVMFENFSGTKTSTQLLSDDNHTIRIDELFSPDTDGKIPKTVILSGDSGSGKSFASQKIMLDWASGKFYSEHFDVVFLLKCEELMCISEEVSLIELLSWSCSLTSDQITQTLQESPEKVLFLIDGFEHVSHPPIKLMLLHSNPSKRAPIMDTLKCLLRGFMLTESFLLVTTRSTPADTMKNLLKVPQRSTEIMGFSERGVEEYFQKFFQDEQVFRKAYESVTVNKPLLAACSVPLVCWIVCLCLKKHLKNNVMKNLLTTTSIYLRFAFTVLEHHCTGASQSQSVFTLLKSLGQLAEEGMEKQQLLFDERTVFETGLDAATSVFLCKGSLKGKDEPVYKFIHFSFQEFFTALYYVLLDEGESWRKVCDLLTWESRIATFVWPSSILKGRRSNPNPPILLFLCGLFHNELRRPLFKKYKWTVPQIIKRKKRTMKRNLKKRILAMAQECKIEWIVLHCLYELHDEMFVKRALEAKRNMDFSSVSLRSTDCWVLLYCLQCCPHIREVNLIYCDLTADKLRILQPALCMCESLRLMVDHLSEVGDLIEALGESKTFRQLNSSECAEHVSLLLSSFYPVSLKLRLNVVTLSESWASGIISLIQTCTRLQKLHIEEENGSHKSLFSSLSVVVCDGDIRLDLKQRQNFESLSKFSVNFPHSALSSIDWKVLLQRFHKATRYKQDSPECNEHVDALFSFLHTLCGSKRVELMIFSLNKSWAVRILSLIQAWCSLQEICVCVIGLLLEEGLMLLQESLTDPLCTVVIKGRRCSKATDQCTEEHWICSCNEKVEIYFKPKVLEELEKLNMSEPEPSGMNLHPLPDCQCCVHIVDSDQWIQVEPSVYKDGVSKFRISTLPGRYECTRTRLRWVCDCDVTLQYHPVDGCVVTADLERLQCERIGPVIDLTVISGTLEEAHLPHYACLAKSDFSLRDAVKVLSKKDVGVSLQSVELTRFHAKIVQPSFSLTTLIINWIMQWEEHCNLLLYMRCQHPLILHVYFFPLGDTCAKEKVELNEQSSLQIIHPRPGRPFRMKTPHLLEVPGASVQPTEGVTFRREIIPNFFKVYKPLDGDVHMNLIREEDQKSVWTAIIYKDELAQINPRQIQNEPQLNCETDEAMFFDKHWSALIERVKNVKSIADKLFEQRLIHNELYFELILTNITSQDSMRKICCAVHSSGKTAKAKLISILQEKEPYLLQELVHSNSSP